LFTFPVFSVIICVRFVNIAMCLRNVSYKVERDWTPKQTILYLGSCRFKLFRNVVFIL
jgi:hypothetical protein